MTEHSSRLGSQQDVDEVLDWLLNREAPLSPEDMEAVNAYCEAPTPHAMDPEEHRHLIALMRLVQHLQEALQPFQPEPTFRRELHQQLVWAANQRAAQQNRGWQHLGKLRARSWLRDRYRPPWKLAVAATASGVSVAVGVATVVVWSRNRSNAASSSFH